MRMSLNFCLWFGVEPQKKILSRLIIDCNHKWSHLFSYLIMTFDLYFSSLIHICFFFYLVVICFLCIMVGEKDDFLQSISMKLNGKKLFTLELCAEKFSEGKRI